ncbi:hypothetical protein EHR01_10570 [Leptospira mtsangambouensis]|uniref:Secreted protein n=1 Tax=Leptospira mtsangambouensis TaxID=2484912 RepID=A0ABY2NYX2_9LEPT|nr:hypothetical protein EHR01_10570 [Leptospira mtsangambouensis]
METLRFGTYGLAWAAPHRLLSLLLLTQPSCQSLTSRSGTQGQPTSVSLVRYAQDRKIKFKIRSFKQLTLSTN